jgi:Ca2+-binding RTX toxin-like protein
VDRINGGEGDDLVLGGRGDDSQDYVNYVAGSLFGGPGADVIRGGPGDDHLNGGGGIAVDGADFLYGGTGNDQLADNAYRFYGDVYYSQWTDDANDSLFGGPGGDGLITSGGDDYQYGGSGNDALGHTKYNPYEPEDDRVEDIGDDTYDGGPGRDAVLAGRASSTPVLFDLSTGRAFSESLEEDTSQP